MTSRAVVASLRPLSGLRVGISISESEESEQLGFPSWQVNRATVQMATALLGQGAGVVLGHDWREDGVMQAVHAFAQQMQPIRAASTGEAGGEDGGAPLLENVLPWDDVPSLSADERERLAATLRVEVAGLPDDLHDLVMLRPLDWVTPSARRYLRARALTHLRRLLSVRADARLCIGGRTDRYQGRFPGVVEEALFTLASGRPLYLSGLLGGATRQLIDAVADQSSSSMPAGWTSRDDEPSIGEVYAQMSESGPARTLARSSDAKVDPEGVWEEFRLSGVRSLARANGLSEDENRTLFRERALDTVVQLVLTGLSRLKERGDASDARA
jgi:hypothetical protein